MDFTGVSIQPNNFIVEGTSEDRNKGRSTSKCNQLHKNPGDE